VQQMVKKLIVTVSAAGALFVPVAGAAWADSPEPGSHGVGAGGIPREL
jgi:fructose-1-phosphate kinase PfkB-like protein